MLSSKTANYIRGSKPYLVLSNSGTPLNNLNELLVIKVPDFDEQGNLKQIDISMAETIIKVPVDMKYSDVVLLIPADGNSYNIPEVTVGDDDGDAAHGASVNGLMTATWYNEEGKVNNLNEKLSACGGPYTLILEVKNVNAHTLYGAPDINNYGSISTNYKFIIGEPSLCYLQPKDMTVFDFGRSDVNMKFNEGFNSQNWMKGKGFKSNSIFPTTAFYKAEFSLIGSGNNQKLFRCSSNSNEIMLSTGSYITKGPSSWEDGQLPDPPSFEPTSVGSNCTITFNTVTKPKSPIIIDMEYNDNGSWRKIYSFEIPILQKWAIGKNKMKYGNMDKLSTSTDFPILDACRMVSTNINPDKTSWQQAAGQTTYDRSWRQQYLYRRDELTNSPYTKVVEGSSPNYIPNYFSRDIGTFMGEWGEVYNYTDSPWAVDPNYWTAEAMSIDQQFEVFTLGNVYYHKPTDIYTAICRGD